MKLSLVVLTPGKQEGKALPITLAQFVIGRDPDCQLRPASPSISKRHCAVIQRDGKVFVRDFDSTNGTFVNDVPLKGEAELHDGDKLKLGPLLFGVKIDATAAPTGKSSPELAAAKVAAAEKPAKQPAAKPAGKASKDDDIAAMLLSLGDDDSSGAGLAEVPEGSTVMDMVAPTDGTDPNSPAPDTKEKPKAAPASTSNAAKSILEKYMKRPR